MLVNPPTNNDLLRPVMGSLEATWNVHVSYHVLNKTICTFRLIHTFITMSDMFYRCWCLKSTASWVFYIINGMSTYTIHMTIFNFNFLFNVFKVNLFRDNSWMLIRAKFYGTPLAKLAVIRQNMQKIAAQHFKWTMFAIVKVMTISLLFIGMNLCVLLQPPFCNKYFVTLVTGKFVMFFMVVLDMCLQITILLKCPFT